MGMGKILKQRGRVRRVVKGAEGIRQRMTGKEMLMGLSWSRNRGNRGEGCQSNITYIRFLRLRGVIKWRLMDSIFCYFRCSHSSFSFFKRLASRFFAFFPSDMVVLP